MSEKIDIFIIGGGINGTAIAADAAGRDLSVILCEKGDLASGTSSASTKLVHGGLRYLEFYEFNLVRKALQEREILMRRAPNLITPLEFVLPYEKHLRSPWLIRLGLFIYDHLSKRNFLPSSKSVNFKTDVRGKALLSEFEKGFSYFDCFTDDARLVVLNAKSAREKGAKILTKTQFIAAQRENNLWKIELKNLRSGENYFCYAKALVNVAGPWVNHVQEKISSQLPLCNIKLVKGSHIVLPKLYEGNFAYLLECEDKRVVFTIPYQHGFTLIGTTDIGVSDLDDIKITAEEKNYLCHVTNHYFKKQIQPSEIIWSYAGVRCLQSQNGAELATITRDSKFILDPDSAPLLTIVGGKLTTHRILAEEALDKLKPYFPKMGLAWTGNKSLPGCDFGKQTFADYARDLHAKYHWLPEFVMKRYTKNYGTDAALILDGTTQLSDLGMEFTAGLYQKEVEFLIQHEWAKTAEDILWRRSKLGLSFSPSETKKLENWLALYFSETAET